MKFLRAFIIGSQCALVAGLLAEHVADRGGGSPGRAGYWPGRRQATEPIIMGEASTPGTGAAEYNQKPVSTTPRLKRSTRYRITFHKDRIDDCDFSGLMCMRAFKTGILCGRTAYYTYDTFTNACELDYVNCVTGHERWMVMHMGECLGARDFKLDYGGDNTYRSREDFLNNDYVVSEIGA